MKKLALAIILAGTTTTAVAGLAFADSHREDRGERMIEKFDTNGDGDITKAEVDAIKAAKFAEADTDGNGGLSMAELDAWQKAERARRMAERKQRRFDRRDENSDGVISVDEFDGRGAYMFDRVDANDDGTLSADELEKMKAHHGKRHGGRHHHRGGPDKD